MGGGRRANHITHPYHRLFQVLGDEHVGLAFRQDTPRLGGTAANQPRHHRNTQARCPLHPRREQVRELGQVGDAGEHAHQHGAQRPMRRDPLQHAHHPRRTAAHLAGADVAEIQRLHAARGEFVDQHHRKAGARGDQTDLAFRVDVHVIEALGQLAIGIGIGLRPCLDQRGDARLAFHRTKVHHKLRVTGNTPGGRDEQRIDLRQRQFTFDQHIRQPASDRGNMAAPLLGLACHQFGECLDHRIGMRRAWPPLRRTGPFDIDAALSGVKNAEPIIRRRPP